MEESLLEYLNSDEFKDYIEKNLIEYKEVNGIKIVDDHYVSKVLRLDPFSIVENFLKDTQVEYNEKDIVKGSLLMTLINSKVKDVISDLNQDTKFSNKVEDYQKVLKRLGFEKVYEKSFDVVDDGYFSNEESLFKGAKIIEKINPAKGMKLTKIVYSLEEKEFIYWNKDYSMMLHFDTYKNESVNKANLIFNGKRKDNFAKEHPLPLSSSYIGGEVTNYKIDAREMLVFNMTEILKTIEVQKKWLNFDDFLHSHLTHKEVKVGESEKWSNIAIGKIKYLPEDVLKNLFENNVIESEYLDYVKENFNIKNDIDDVKGFIKDLNDNYLEKITALDFLDESFDMFFDSIKNLGEEKGFDLERLKQFDMLFLQESRERGKRFEKIDFSNYKDVLENMPLNKLKRKKESKAVAFKIFPEMKEVSEILDIELAKKEKKEYVRKNKLN